MISVGAKRAKKEGWNDGDVKKLPSILAHSHLVPLPDPIVAVVDLVARCLDSVL